MSPTSLPDSNRTTTGASASARIVIVDDTEDLRELLRFALVRAERRSAGDSAGESMVTVMSFAPTALRRVRLLAPTVPTVLLLERHGPARRTRELPTGTSAGFSLALVRAHPKLVARTHEHGHPAYVWTVDDPKDIAFVLGLGVDAVISNDPGTAIRVRAELARRNSENQV